MATFFAFEAVVPAVRAFLTAQLPSIQTRCSVSLLTRHIVWQR